MRLIATYSSLEHSAIAHVNEGSHSITYSAPLLMASVFRRVRNCRFIMIIIVILAHQHKAACSKTRLDIQNYGCNGNLLCDHGVAERNRISSLQTMERRWKRNVVSRVSSVIVVIRLPISCVSSMAISCHVPAVSMANG